MTTQTTTDIQAFINRHPFSKYQWMILVLCFVTVAMDGFDTAIIGFIASDLVQEWGVQKSDLGPVMSAALVGLAFGALTAGPMADRIGRKKVLVLSILVFGGFSFVEFDAQAWFLVGVDVALAEFRQAGEHVEQRFARAFQFLDHEVRKRKNYIRS